MHIAARILTLPLLLALWLIFVVLAVAAISHAAWRAFFAGR